MFCLKICVILIILISLSESRWPKSRVEELMESSLNYYQKSENRESMHLRMSRLIRLYTLLRLYNRRYNDSNNKLSSIVQNLETYLFPFINKQTFQNLEQHQDSFKGRGLVTSASKDQIHVLIHSLYNLIYILKTPLPIQIITLERPNDIQPDHLEFLKSLPNVTVIPLSSSFDTRRLENVKGFTIKPFLALTSTFKETILFDADTVFFTDPATLFTEPGYVLTGTLFYRDRFMRGIVRPKAWEFLRGWVGPFSVFAVQTDFVAKRNRMPHEMESGIKFLLLNIDTLY
jgi:hypothetical protein